MIEVNANRCRFIMWCENIDNVIDPLKSRCVCIRVPRPTKHRLFAYLVYIALLNKGNPSIQDIDNIIEYSKCNIKKALWCLQLYLIGSDYTTTYDNAINKITDFILKTDLRKMETIRDIFFNIMITNISGVAILKDVLQKLISNKNLSKICKIQIATKTSEIEYNMIRGRRMIIHFDTYIIQIMNIIQKCNTIVSKNKKN